LWNVHVHTDDAGAAIDAGAAVGHAHRIRVTPLGAGLITDVEMARDAHVVRLVIGDDSPIAAVRDVLCEAGATLADDGRPAVVLVDATLSGQPLSGAQVAVDTPVAALAALAVHDPALPVADDAAAMAAAAAAVRCVRMTGGDSNAADRCVDALRALIDERSELVTVVAERSCAARIEESMRAAYPHLEMATVACDGADVWLGVE